MILNSPCDIEKNRNYFTGYAIFVETRLFFFYIHIFGKRLQLEQRLSQIQILTMKSYNLCLRFIYCRKMY